MLNFSLYRLYFGREFLLYFLFCKIKHPELVMKIRNKFQAGETSVLDP